MKKVLLLFIYFITFQVYSQKDSIVNYLGRKGVVIKDKSKATAFEIITKKNDTLWLTRRFRRNGKMFAYWHTSDRGRENKIGESILLNNLGKVSTMYFYNNKGKKHGRYISWFDNSKRNTEGLFLNGSKEGVWKYYRFNGSIASRVFYKKDSVVKKYFYNEKGMMIDYDENFCGVKAKFKGGEKKFNSKVQNIVDNLGYKLKGKVFVSFNVDINGRITNVRIDEKLPKKLEARIISFFEKIEGWEPTLHMNRKIPVNFSIALNFRE